MANIEKNFGDGTICFADYGQRAGSQGRMIMSSDDSMPLTIGCEAEVMHGPKLHFVIEFEFEEVRADHVGMWVRLRVESHSYETGRWYYWWNIRDFVDHDEVHSSSAKLWPVRHVTGIYPRSLQR